MGHRMKDSHALSPKFVGRTRELGEIRAALRRLPDGIGQTLLVHGEPGIGKTSLSTELTQIAAADGVRAFWGRCSEDGGAPAYWPWLQILRALGTAGTEEDGWTETLDRLAAQRHVELEPGGASISQEARFALYERIAELVAAAATETPTLLIVDDLHAADLASLMVLRAVAARTRVAPLLVIGNYREIELQRDVQRQRVVAEIARYGTRIPLAGLSPDEVVELIGGRTADPVGATLGQDLHRRTDGNPLFVGELLRLVEARGQSGLTGTEVAQGIRDVIVERLQPLSGPCQNLLSMASVLGYEIETRTLAAMMSSDLETILPLVAEAERGGMLRTSPERMGRLRFHHMLTRDSLYQGLPSHERALAHRAAAEAIEALHRTDPAPVLPELAHHYALAASVGVADRAVAFSRRAGESAMGQWAYEEAAEHFERALEALALVAEPTTEERGELMIALAAAWQAAADDRAQPLLQETAELARRYILAGEASGAILFSRAVIGLCDRGLGTPEHVPDERREALLSEALGYVDTHQRGIRAHLLALLAMERAGDASDPSCEQMTADAVDLARELGDPSILAIALCARHFVLWRRHRIRERIGVTDEILTVAQAIRNKELEQLGRSWHMLDMMVVGRAGDAEAELQRYSADAERLRQPRFTWGAESFRAILALWRGQWREAIAFAISALELGVRIGDSTARTTPGIQRFFALRELGEVGDDEGTIRFAMAQFPASPTPRTLLAALLVDTGRLDEARLEFEVLAAEDFQNLTREFRIGVLPLLAEVCGELGDAKRAALLFEHVAPLAQLNLPAGLTAFFGSGARYTGILAGAMGRRDLARQHLATAIVHNMRMGSQPWLAWSQFDLARMMLDDGIVEQALPNESHVTARELREHAGEIAKRLDMKRLAGRLATLATRPESGRVRSKRRLCAFRLDGDFWSIGEAARVVRLRDVKGLRYVAQLLRHPDREFHALDLADELPGGNEERPREFVGGDVVLDAQARREYRQRLISIRAELDEAQANNDRGRSELLEHELAVLTQQLSRGLGLHGRERISGSAAEKARLNVTRAIKAVVKRIGEEDQDLGRYLETTIRTGTFCSYTPDQRFPIDWQL